jgi:hypothetical protein
MKVAIIGAGVLGTSLTPENVVDFDVMPAR